VTHYPFPGGSEHSPFGIMRSKVQGAMSAMSAMGYRLPALTRPSAWPGLPCRPRGHGHLCFSTMLRFRLRPRARPRPRPGDRARGAITTRNGRFVSAAALRQRKYWISGARGGDDGMEWRASHASRALAYRGCATGLHCCRAAVRPCCHAAVLPCGRACCQCVPLPLGAWAGPSL
jgi:hypothetical protein